jgi:CRISPR-associated endonuclease/helicase Cas3
MAVLLNIVDSLSPDWRAHLLDAARWHDAGKAHDAFQLGMRRANPQLGSEQLWAKSGVKSRLRHGRSYFRHELVSALAALHHGVPFPAAYILAAHHGRVRLGIRALPDEEFPADPSMLFALGVWQGDPLPEVDLSGGVLCSRTVLDLSPMLLGAESSWTGRALEMLAEHGPFRLAYFEALLRAADARASRKEASA